ncbi:MAG TPA: chitobiase/beta-hexosaminidase C-terminal domain-containing protein, partial [Chthoniobacterales bacterium]
SDPLLGAGTSLREALVYAQSLGGPRTITFAPALAGQTITLSTGWTNAADESALRIGGEITLQGLTTSPGVTITMATGVEKRHITVDGGGKLDVSNLTFTNGKVGAGGNGSGGSIESNGALAIRNCTFTGNSTLWDGGAVLASYGSPSLLIENSTFSGNSSTYNANAISTGATQSILRFVTATNNTGGDAVILLDDISVTMVNSILDGNAPDTIYNVNRGFGGRFNSQTSTNNIFGASFVPGLTNGQNGNRSGVPVSQLKLAALANNGGPTATVALQLGSLAIDAGVAIPGLTTDQRGIARPNGSAPDVGAFELVQTQAAIPIVSPLGGAYENSVQVSIANTSLNATVRYTLDGSTPTSSNGQIYTAPFTLTKNTTVKAIAYGGGWLDSPIASVGYTVLPPLPFWRNLHGLPADGSQDGATPARDGVANLLKFAFNLAPNAGDLSRPNVTILPPNGTAGLPRVTRDSEGRLVLEFVRRKAATDSSIAYIVETSGDLLEWAPLSLTSASVTSIDNVWERVSVTDPTIAAKRFGRVRVGEVVPYFNDFNAEVGAASLRGHAAWTNQAVRLTDTVADQLSAVVLNGITLGSHITGFRARFNLQLGPTTTSQPADGASFAVGNLGSGGWGERGPNTAHYIAVGFDTYPGSGNDSIGVHVWVNGIR